MNEYRVFEHSFRGIEAVKQGWSWPAFFFSELWALFKQMWIVGGGMLVAGFFLLQFLTTDSVGEGRFLSMLYGLAVRVLFGVYGNASRERNLETRGYEFMGAFAGAVPQDAVEQYLNAKQRPQAPCAGPINAPVNGVTPSVDGSQNEVPGSVVCSACGKRYNVLMGACVFCGHLNSDSEG